MANIGNTYRSLEALARASQHLKTCFTQLVSSLDVLSGQGSSLQGLTVEKHVDEGYFRIEFCGREFDFRFSITRHADGAPRGRISCFTSFPTDPEKLVLVKSFTFKRTGEIDEPKAEDSEDPPNTNDGFSGAYLVASCILEACNK